MKMLVIKLDHTLTQEERAVVSESFSESYQTGILFVDPSITYEVVEFDSLYVDKGYMFPAKKTDRRDIMRRHLKTIRERREYLEKFKESTEDVEGEVTE